jgi:nitroimidazol reductase NimA-like FMN-containing flavoprotein (pyridoxamine 5'-phosphate oxidase superfamily)
MPKIDMANQMKSLLRRKSSCVLTTTDGDTPHCPLMAYITSEAADRLLLIAPRNTRKYRKITHHPNVSLLIDTRGELARYNTQALTLTGTCYTLDDDEEIAFVKQAFNRHHPHLNNFIGKASVAFLCIEFDLIFDGPENAHHETLRTKHPKQVFIE